MVIYTQDDSEKTGTNWKIPLPSGGQAEHSLLEFSARKVDFIHSWGICDFHFALRLFMGILRKIKASGMVRNEMRGGCP